DFFAEEGDAAGESPDASTDGTVSWTPEASEPSTLPPCRICVTSSPAPDAPSPEVWGLAIDSRRGETDSAIGARGEAFKSPAPGAVKGASGRASDAPGKAC